MSIALPVAVLALFLATAWMVAAAWLPAWSRVVALAPALARGSVLAAALPAVVGLVVAVAMVLPGDPHLGHAPTCHCVTSMPGWMHLCPLHPAAAAPLLWPSLALVAILVPGRIRGLLAALRLPGVRHASGEIVVAPLPQRTAVVAGWLSPRIVVDTELWERLDEEERAVVVAHERGHLARRDPLVLALLRSLCALGPAHGGLVAAWSGRAELAADRVAAREVGDPVRVAETLLRCARLRQGPAPVLSWTGGALEDRVRHLLEGPAWEAPRPDVDLRDLAALLAAVALATLATPQLHHRLEHLLNLSF